MRKFSPGNTSENMWTDDPPYTQRRGDFLISTDRTLLDVAAIHDFLAHHSYWAAGIPLEVVQRSIAGALCFGLYDNGRQIGFTDLADPTRFLEIWDRDVYQAPQDTPDPA